MTRLLIVKVFRANCFQICLLALNLGLAALLVKLALICPPILYCYLQQVAAGLYDVG